MITVFTTTGRKSFDVIGYKAKTPRFKRANFLGIEIRESTLEVVRARFTGLPDLPAATSVYYPGELGLFVYENLQAYLKQSKATPMKKVSEREKYYATRFQN